MAKFKVGDKVGYYRGNEPEGPLEVLHIEGNKVWFTSGTWLAAHLVRRWPIAALKAGTPPSWDYAEAQRLQDIAKQAVKEYNEYIDRKPETVFLKLADY